jgi:hypothetical protein
VAHDLFPLPRSVKLVSVLSYRVAMRRNSLSG